MSSGAAHGDAAWTSAYLQSHGGVVGEGLYQLTDKLAQGVGVDILVVFLLFVGATLITGASLGGALRATGSGVAETTRMMRSLGARHEDPEQALPEGSEIQEFAPAPPGFAPPEPDTAELVVRATHVEGPAQEDPAIEHEPLAQQEQAEPDAGAQDPVAEVGEEDEEISGVARTDVAELTPQGRLREAVTDDPSFVWEMPDASKLLTRSTGEQARPDTAGQAQTATSLVEALGHFGVQAKVIGTVAGPHITRYELRLAPGTKVAKVAQLKDDLAYALAATDIRILAPIPGKQAVGVEVPNAHRRIVRLGDVFQEPPKDWSPLTVWLGKDVAGKAIGADLAKMPHLLVAGTTGGEVGGDQRDALQRAAARDPARGAPGAGRPQAGGAQPLRVDPAPAHAGDHEPAHGGQRAAEPRQGDGAALRDHVAGAHARPDRAQQSARQARRSAAVHPLRDRRARGPDDGRAGRRRGLDHPPRAEGARSASTWCSPRRARAWT